MGLSQWIIVIALLLSKYGSETALCGYDSCPEVKPDMLNIHIICHTHDDVGWLHTVDTYYDMWVKDIISSVVNSLIHHENRKFVYVETAFFSKWWNQQTDLVKEYVRRLVKTGRLEFANGGWSMNDEATTHYLGIIDQMTLGLRWLNDTFGLCAAPRVGWQVDTFGHSRELASLFSQMHFDGEFIGRLHYQDKFTREKSKTMEVMWQASDSLGEKAKLFLAVLPNVYWPPKGYCFDVNCDDEELTDENIAIKTHNFLNLATEQAKNYATNHISFTMGMDFYYRDASKWYRNLDMLIKHINSLQDLGMKVNAFYSSPACYLYALNNLNRTWPTIKTDFFPYASKQHEYWTGYFTSRPGLKFHARRSSAFLQACRQLMSLSNLETSDVNILAKALGVVQHHDGITGTEKQHVADDYTRHLSIGVSSCENIISKSLKKLVTYDRMENGCMTSHIKFCSQLNISQCDFTEVETKFYLIVYNSFAQEMISYVRLPLLGSWYNVTPHHDNIDATETQIVPIPLPVLNLPERLSLAKSELVFPVALQPMSIHIYSVDIAYDYEPVNNEESATFSTFVQDAVIQNEFYQVKIDAYSGLIKEIFLTEYSIEIPLKQSFYYYQGMPGYRIERASGAYAFNPQYDMAFSLGENVTYRVIKGSLVEEVHQYYTPWISQVIRVYKGQPYVEFDWVVGPIPVSDNIGREIITRFDTDIDNSGTFYTDSSGRETIKRIRNYQEHFSWNITEHIAGNYYPVTSWIYIQDITQDIQLSILTDRAEGGSSVRDGSLELMVHRRLLFDDGFGVNEALNEPGYDGKGLIVRGKHQLILGKIADMMPLNKILAKQLFYSPILGFVKNDLSFTASCVSASPIKLLTENLPSNVHVLSLEKIDSNKLLLRLENFFEKSDYPDDKTPVAINLRTLFERFYVTNVQETTLAANTYLNEIERLNWSHEDETETTDDYDDADYSYLPQEEMVVTLKPMEIRTFILTVYYHDSGQ